MLCQGLEEMGGTQPVAVSSGKEALQAATADDYDLVIVDMDLDDMESCLLVRALREEQPNLPLMVIPLEGEEIPSELADVTVQGTLPKPFFLPELPDRIQAALARSAGEELTPASAPASEQHPAMIRQMTRLSQEAGAQAVMLTRGKELVAHVGRLPDEEVTALASLVYESWHTSARVAKVLGKEQIRFEQSIEGDEYLLYSLALPDTLILSVVVEGQVPLGMIRHRAKETAEQVRELIGNADIPLS
jgi:DNA-binding response OmpR family regulator